MKVILPVLSHTYNISVDQTLQCGVIMLFCRKLCVTSLLICLISIAGADHHLNTNDHFIDDEQSWCRCQRGTGVVSFSDPFRTMTDAELSVSGTIFASLDQIHLTRASTLTFSPDGFLLPATLWKYPLKKARIGTLLRIF